jgi:hypothetical protein
MGEICPSQRRFLQEPHGGIASQKTGFFTLDICLHWYGHSLICISFLLVSGLGRCCHILGYRACSSCMARRRFTYGLHRAISQKMTTFITTAVTTSVSKPLINFSGLHGSFVHRNMQYTITEYACTLKSNRKPAQYKYFSFSSRLTSPVFLRAIS